MVALDVAVAENEESEGTSMYTSPFSELLTQSNAEKVPKRVLSEQELREKVKLQLEALYEVLGADPYNVSTLRQMADLLRNDASDYYPNHGLVSFALNMKGTPPSERFANRVEALYEWVFTNLRDPTPIVEFVRGRIVIPPQYDPSQALRFHGGSLEEVGDVIFVQSQGDLPPRGAIVWVPRELIRECALESCRQPFLKRSWNHQYHTRECRRDARRLREQNEHSNSELPCGP